MRSSRLVRVAVVVGGLLSAVSVGCSSGSTTTESLVDAASPHRDAASTTCTPNTLQCASSGVSEVCSASGEWVPTACAAGEACLNGICSAKDAATGCTPNAKQCLSSTIAEVCPPGGGAWIGVACAAGETCTNGVCAAPDAGPTCPPNTQDCVSATLARVCPSDGSGWLAVECAAGQVCSAGACVLEMDAPCTPGVGTCTSDTAGVVCNTAGTAYEAVTCPKNTTCMGGNCYGAVEVNSSECTSVTTIATSPDGFTYTQSACPTGTYCVSTGSTTAACLAGNCTPDLTGNGCDSVCGNMVDSTANQADYVSTCVSSTTGYQWVAVQCPAPGTCSPTATTCGPAYTPAPGCVSQCTPGATQCTIGGVQTCGNDGTWGKAVACDVTAGLVCQTVGGNGFCGDPVCFDTGATGTCTASGLFQACTPAFTLEPLSNATACPTGTTCQTTPTTGSGAIQPGACSQSCVPGSSSCVENGVAVCGSNGVAGAPTACTGSTTCQQYTDDSGQAAAVCGHCTPGTHRCSPTTTDGGAAPDIQTCGTNGEFSAPVACQTGACEASGTDFACIAECVPGGQTCGGTGGTQIATCSATGTVGAFTSCPSGQSCRVDSNGNAVGCVVCLGPDHGLPADQECTTTAAGVPGTAALDTCGPNDTWLPPVTCGHGQTCGEGTANACETFGELGYTTAELPPPLTASSLISESELEMIGDTCANLSYSTPVACGSTSDCCSAFCLATPAPMCM